MEVFCQMINHCIGLGLQNDITSLKKFSAMFYHELDGYQIYSRYKLNAISQACRILSIRKRAMKKGIIPASPFVRKLFLISCYGFKINGRFLTIPVGDRKYVNIVLNHHTATKLTGAEPRAFIITPNSLSICIRKEVQEVVAESVIGIDRNLRNVTISTQNETIMYRTEKLLSIKENTTHVVASFKRNDRRVKKFYQKRLGNRRARRVRQLLHKISKDIVSRAIQSKSMIVLEDIKGIRKLYRKGNGQGKNYRRKLNSWSFYELQRQIQYKSEWEGIPVRFVDPKCTSQLCPICGNRIQGGRFHSRKLWCGNCERLMDRDVVAAMNISYKGWSGFFHPRGLSVEAMRGNVDKLKPLILRADGSNLQIKK
ncbi:MAG: transposase [Thaumarchaeota archaeon]|nr:transposase [Nitrososphaerota archaeon]